MTGQPQKEKWQEIQDEFYSDPDKHTHLEYEPGSTYARDLTRHLAEAMGMTAGDSVLEIGAGAGRFTPHLLPFCRTAVATDTSLPLLEALDAVRGDHPGLTTRQLNAFDLPGDFGENAFDAVCGFFILHHLPEHESLFRAVAKTVRRGGRIGFLEPNRINPLFLVQVIVSPEMKWKAEKGMFTFSASRTAELLKVIGFKDVRIERMGFFPPPILDRFSSLLHLQRWIERLPIIHRFLPFVIITAVKP